MKKNLFRAKTPLTRVTAIIMVVSLLVVGTFALSASAQTAKDTTRMNVVLVIDGSGSLISSHGATDPHNLRYDAIDLFLALLTDEGNNVGAIVFNEGSTTFRLDEALTKISGKSGKLELSGKIRRASAGGDTNIGAALLKAVTDANAMSKQNGLKSVVILFSDGRTDVGNNSEALEASLQAKEDATVLAQECDIPVYTICLAATNGADPDELEEIATRTSGMFVKVKDAKDLTAAFEAFYQMIFGTAGTEIQKMSFPADGCVQVPVIIPSYGAEEVNVILDTTNLINVSISTPNGDMSEAELEEATMSGGYYDVIKLVAPPAGEYLINLKGIPENSVTVNVLFNVNVSAALQTADSRNEYSSGETVIFQANLFQNGAAIQDAAVTNDYTAVLNLTDLSTGTSDTYPMYSDGNGTFFYTLQTQSYSSYRAEVTFTFEDLVFTSNAWDVYFDNTAPVANPTDLVIKKTVWPFFGRSCILELSDYFSDAQDETLSRYQLVSSELVQDSMTLDEQTGRVDVNTGKSKSGTVIVKAFDSKGAAAQMSIHFQITDLTYVISGSALLFIFVGGFVFFMLLGEALKHSWKGELEVRVLPGGARQYKGDFRGKLKLNKFALGNCGVDGYFHALPRNQLEFVSKKPIYIATSLKQPKKRVSIVGSNVKIFTDPTMTKGIEILAKPQMVRSSGAGGFGGRAGGFGGPAAARKTPASKKRGPF